MVSIRGVALRPGSSSSQGLVSEGQAQDEGHLVRIGNRDSLFRERKHF